jgi:hypothetical protein
MQEELTHLQRVGSGENRSRMSSAFHNVRSRTRWLLSTGPLHNYRVSWEKTGKRIPPRSTPAFKLLAATERNHIDAALNKSVGEGRHTAKRPETDEKQCIGEPGNTKKQRQDRTPKYSSHSYWGMPRSIPILAAKL